MVIYLSPADYHRFHSPAIHTGDYRRHVVGYLSPVKPSHVNKHKDVFKNNERVNIFGRWAQGFYFESAVGATNVGSIKLDFDTDVLTNSRLLLGRHVSPSSQACNCGSTSWHCNGFERNRNTCVR